MRDYELDGILENPFKYNFIIFKNFLINKNFTLATYNNKKMQNFFLNSDHNELNKNLVNYFNELNIFADDNNLEINDYNEADESDDDSSLIKNKVYNKYSRKRNYSFFD